MKSPVASRLLALAALLAFAAVSFSALAGWSVAPPDLIASGAPEPAPVLLIGLAITAAGLFLRGAR